MGKITKSVRLDQEIESMVEEYCKFMDEVMEVETSFSKIVPLALSSFIYEKMRVLKEGMSNSTIGHVTETGSLILYEFTKEQIARAEKVEDEAGYLMMYYDRKIQR